MKLKYIEKMMEIRFLRRNEMRDFGVKFSFDLDSSLR